MKRRHPEFFKRQDEDPDGEFYREPHFENYLDTPTSQAARDLYDTLLPEGGHILDLMAGSHSHLPAKFSRVVGLGLNAQELAHNPQLDAYVVHDLNLSPTLPFKNEVFDGAVCTISVEYLINPTRIFKEVGRVLKPRAVFVVTFSHSVHPTKAVLVWRSSDDATHLRLVKYYFVESGLFSEPQTDILGKDNGCFLQAVWANMQPLTQKTSVPIT